MGGPPPSPQPQAPSTAAQPATPPQGWSEPHQRGYLKVKRAVDPSWLDATTLTADSVEVRRGEDPDGEVDGDKFRSMRSLPSSLSGLLGGIIMTALGERDLLGERNGWTCAYSCRSLAVQPNVSTATTIRATPSTRVGARPARCAAVSSRSRRARHSCSTLPAPRVRPCPCCLTRATCYSLEATAGTQAPATLA